VEGELLAGTFVELAGAMVADFDVIDFLLLLSERSARLLRASAAGVLLADPRGGLRLAAASPETAPVLELFRHQSDQGPCLECLRTGRAVTVPDLRDAGQRWPQFAAAAGQAGFGAAYALPMRLRTQAVGALSLFRAAPGPFSPQDMRAAQALADMATVGLLQERGARRSETLTGQLQGALNSRIVIEQAKGKLAERLSLDMDQAFTVLRASARERNLRLSGLARRVAESTPADLAALIPAPRDREDRTGTP
jgi:hypothetical protein